jgi:ABC-type dipeptide/oligopeptide/nickel transport system ATPase component
MRDKIIGFFGQSGSGKTTVIRSLPTIIDKLPTLQYTGIIRSLFQNNPDRYTNPEKLLLENKEELDKLPKKDKNAKIQEIYEKYTRSQLQLLNDYSTEVFNVVREPQIVPSIVLFDRSPVDFYVLTLCGLEYLKNKLDNTKINNVCEYYLNIIKKTAEHNSNFLFDNIITIHPWNENTEQMLDGVRDQYLTDFYTGDNWYENFKEIKLNKVSVYNINKENLTIDSRVGEIVKILKNDKT